MTGFARTREQVCRPLAARAKALHSRLQQTVILGLCGSQGSGKSTIAAETANLLRQDGLSVAVLSLDDLYLGRAERHGLAARVHPLLATRGPPGTHDVNLGCATLDSLASEGRVALPVFDKAIDERAPRETWPEFETPVDLVVFEGWLVGSTAQPVGLLTSPVNDLERLEDPDGVWRGFSNAQLAGPYQKLFARIDLLVFLQAPDFEIVSSWRGEAEAKLRARTGGGMAPAEIARFVAHYERLTRWMLQVMPARADWTVPLAPDRTPFP